MRAPVAYLPERDRAADDREILRFFGDSARTFALAARLLPRSARLPVATLYLYCRTVDEIADQRPAGIAAADELADARAALAATLGGAPPPDGPHALLWNRLGEVHHATPLDAPALGQLLDGAEWDVQGRPIVDRADLLAYSDLVAGSVGAMMLSLLVPDDQRRRDLAAPARALGQAMQVTNVLRDVGEDRDILGRAYLPTVDLEHYDVDLASLDGRPLTNYANLCEDLMALAESLYDEASSGIDALPVSVRGSVRAAARMYREILNEVRRARYDNITRRAVVPLSRRLAAAAGGYEGRRARLLVAAR